MRIGKYGMVALGALALASGSVFGEKAATPASTTSKVLSTAEVPAQAQVSTTASPGFQPKVTGLLYTAAQYYPDSGDADAWNLGRLGYQFTENFHLSYNQIFLNDYRKKLLVDNGLNFRLDDGFVRTKWKSIAKFGEVNLGLEQHFFVPTSALSATRTMMTVFRNRFLVKVPVTNSFAMNLEVSPFIFVHREAGTTTNGKAAANEAFRNFLVLNPTFTVGKFSAFLPVFLQSSRFRPYSADATKSDAWQHQVFFWPEITYAFNDNVELGLMAVTGNLIATDFSSTTIADGIKNVTTALELTLSI